MMYDHPEQEGIVSMNMLGLVWVIIGFLFCWLIWRIRNDNQQQTMLFEQQAQKWNGVVKGGVFSLRSPTLVLPCCEYSVTITSTRTGKKKLPMQTVASTTLTCSRPIRLTIHQGLLNVTGILSKNRRIKTGQQKFDQCFHTIGADEQFVQSVLSESIQQHLLRLSARFSVCRLRVTQHTFHMEISHQVKDRQKYEQFIESVFACLTQIDNCIRIRTIRFDRSVSHELNAPHILVNPDVSTFEIPPFGLEHIVVNVDAYQLHHIEQFVTYAVNTIGQEYLKQTVDVTVIGKIAQLHPNLRNVFANMCHQIVEKDDSRA